VSHVTACAASWVIYVRDANIRPAPARENRDEGMCAIQEMVTGETRRSGAEGGHFGRQQLLAPTIRGYSGYRNTLVVDTNGVSHTDSSPLLQTTNARFWAGGGGGGGGTGRKRERARVGFNTMRVRSDQNHRVASTFDGGGWVQREREGMGERA